ncbi:MAG TPA: hypothetical protein VFB15_13435 [Candidatus Binataceae bacterium]|jgi:hypothetical protein|nr:hypothetical protein [Candidatus Binataceae bacterium]
MTGICRIALAFQVITFALSIVPAANAACDYGGADEQKLQSIIHLRSEFETTQTKSQRVSDLNCILGWWERRDGEIGDSVSDTMLTMARVDPNLFFSFMVSHQRNYQEWLKELPTLSFVWYSAPPSPLEHKRLACIKALTGSEVDAPSAIELRDELIARLRTIRPAQVE